MNSLTEREKLMELQTGLTMNDYPVIEDYANEAIIEAFGDLPLSLYDACNFVDMYESYDEFDDIIHEIFKTANIDYEIDSENQMLIVVDDNGNQIDAFHDVGVMWNWFERRVGK